MKTHFAEQFMAAIMTCDLDNTKKIVRYIEDCQKIGIKILPPTLNHSFAEFDVPASKTISYGLAAIKGIGEGAIKPITEERIKSGPFKDLEDFARRIELHKLGKKTLEILVAVGALDEFGYSRTELNQMLDEVIKWSISIFESAHIGQVSLFSFSSDNSQNSSPAPWSERAKRPLINNKPWIFKDLLEEKKLLGLFLTGHPMELFSQEMKLFSNTSLRDLPRLLQADNKGPRKVEVALVVFLSEQFQRRTAKGSLMASLRLEQVGIATEAVIFEKALLENPLPESNTPVLAIGNLERSFDGSGNRLTLERVIPLSEVRINRVKKINLLFRRPSGHMDQNLSETIAVLSQKLRAKKGSTQVGLGVLYPQAFVEFNAKDFSVELDDELMALINQYQMSGLHYELFTHQGYPS